MNNIFKFRIWDKRNKSFFINEETKDVYFDIWQWTIYMSTCLIYPIEDCIFQHYTGLTDSNDKPIYEGDIVKDTWRESHPYSYCPDEEYNHDEIFEVKYKDYSFNLDKKYSREQTHIEGFRREVISNIFEHSELLK